MLDALLVEGDEELAGVRVGAGVRHGQRALLRVHVRKVLVHKPKSTVYGGGARGVDRRVGYFRTARWAVR